MKKRLTARIIIASFMLLFASAILAHADTIVGTGGWQSWTISALNQNGNPYWDRTSFDGNQRNVGYFLTNTGFFSGGTAGPGAIPYWGNSDGTADISFYFTSSGSSQAALKLEIAGFSDNNVFGWYDINSPLNLHPIFTGTDSPETIATFTPSSSYGFYITSPEGTFRTRSGQGQYQHFAVFQDGNSFWLGIEDLVSCTGSDKDYNDMIVRISPVQTPEPATMLLLGLGLTGIAALRRR